MLEGGSTVEVKQLITKIEGEIRERKALLAALRAYDPATQSTSEPSHQAGGNSGSPRTVHHRAAPQAAAKRSSGWSPERLRKFQATMAAKKKSAK
jgi:hypothetical protein